MNRTRLLKLAREDRLKYIETEMSKLPVQTLQHIASEYGIRGTRNMNKDVLVESIKDGLNKWAEKAILE